MKGSFQIIKWVAYFLEALLLLIFIGLPAYKIYLKNSTRIRTPNGISSLEEITLGGLKQWIFIRGADQRNPILIFLHGGPGAPAGGMSSSRKFDAELINHFTVVHWDQRGAGKSYHRDIPIYSMNFDRLVEDCNELIDCLRNKFNVQKVFLVGHSAGSITGIKTAHRYPEKIDAYIGVAQYINDFERERIWDKFIAEEAEKSGDVKIQDAIKAFGPPSYGTLDKHSEQSGYVFRYGGVIHKNRVRHLGSLMLATLTSPEYSLLEGIKTVRNKDYYFSKSAMWDEIRNVNITKEIQSIKVPIYFFGGKYDMATPTVLVENFCNGLDAEKGKRLVIFEDSAHFLMVEEKEKYQELLINVVLRESWNK
jgi:pimeloyl-ACP methyl ester carboxylesterase